MDLKTQILTPNDRKYKTTQNTGSKGPMTMTVIYDGCLVEHRGMCECKLPYSVSNKTHFYTRAE